MDLNSFVLIGMGFGIGFAVAWFWARARSLGQLREVEDRVGSVSQEVARHASTVAELRKQVVEHTARSEDNRKRLEQEQIERARAETALASERANLDEQKRLLSQAEAKLRDVFRSLAAETLQANSGEFLKLAKSEFAGLQKQASGDLGQRQEAIQGLVSPLRQTLDHLQNRLSDLESARQTAYGELKTLVGEMATTGKELRNETGSLASALRRPQVKGNWGQLTLRRAAELAGMVAHCDFEEQVTVETEDGRIRPDMVVHLPGLRRIVVDAKAPMQAFLDATSAQAPDQQTQLMSRHAGLVRSHVQKLSSKSYWNQLEKTPEFVVCFLPGESFFSAAVEHDHTLIEDAIQDRVVLASPTTLIALLRAVAYGWQQQGLAENAQQISTYGKDLYEKILKFVEHMDNLRSGLERANSAFNDAVGSLEGRVLPSARKFGELGVTTLEGIPSIEPTETPLRRIAAAATENEHSQ